MKMRITDGDALHLIGGYGLGIDYTVRLSLRLLDEIDPDILARAVEKTQQRFPYLNLRVRKDEQDFYAEENPAPIVIHHTDEKISLGTPGSNYHIWSVCYNADRLHLDISHGFLDGTGMYNVLRTLLYYYCAERYGVTDHSGILTLEDPILPEESRDPADEMPDMDLSKVAIPERPAAFSLTEDAGLTPSEPILRDIIIPEEAFVRFSSAHDASPGTMISILMSRTIDELFPERTAPLTNSYVINARPMVGKLLTHHNCVRTVIFTYTDRIKAMPFDRQCTVHRGTTFIQSDTGKVFGQIMVSANQRRMVDKMAPTAEGKKQIFAKMLNKGNSLFTYMVSYVGQWRWQQLSPYILEFWTHVPNVNNLLTEIAAVNGKIFLSLHQNFKEDTVLNCFLRQLDENSISYTVKPPCPNDNPRFPEPDI